MFCCATSEPEPPVMQTNTIQEYSHIRMFGGKLYENDQVFRFASVNVPGLLMLEDRPQGDTLYGFPVCQLPVSNPSFDPNGYAYGLENNISCIIPKPTDSIPKSSQDWVPPTPSEQEDAIVSVSGASGRVIRSYTLGFGARHHITAPKSFYEPAWIAFDSALHLARKHGVRLVVPLINNHNGGDQAGLGNFGDYASLCAFRGLPPSQFYVSTVLRQDLKDIISHMLNRINTINGVKYKEDPTILAWQLGNELGGWDGPRPPTDWIIEMAAHFKSLAPHTLIMDGCIGLEKSRFMKEILEHPNIDIFSSHYYWGESDFSRIGRDATLVTNHGKAFIIGEFGFSHQICQQIFKTAYQNKKVAGALVWSLRYHSRDGGFYHHFEDGGFASFHLPGFPASPGFGNDDLKMGEVLMVYGAKMAGLPRKTPVPLPARAVAGCVSTGALRWMGSAHATGYMIEREGNEGVVILTTFVQDCVASGVTIYQDRSGVRGCCYVYVVKPIGSDGVVNHEDPLRISVRCD